MKKNVIFILFISLNNLLCFPQARNTLNRADSLKKYYSYGKTVRNVYYSFEEADKVPVDSVLGLILKSKEFKKFPKEIVKYKNLQILDLSSLVWDEVYDSLMTKKEKKYVDRMRKKMGLYYVPRSYKPNVLYDIPQEIFTFKKLKYFDWDGAYITLIEVCKLHKLLPDMQIY